MSSLYVLNLSPLSSYSCCRYLLCGFAFLLINGDKLFFFRWTVVANFTGAKFINLFLYVRTWYGFVKIFPYLRTWRCVPKLSSKAEEIIQGLGGYFPPAKHLTVPAVWDQAEVFSQMICLIYNPAVQLFWSFTLVEGAFHQDSNTGRPWTPILNSLALNLTKVHFHLSDASS